MSEERPRIVKKRLGEDVTFKCASEVNTKLITVVWKKLNSDETTNSRMSNRGGHLVIENLQITDAGLYKCDVFSGEERVYPMRSQTFRLEVEGMSMFSLHHNTHVFYSLFTYRCCR